MAEDSDTGTSVLDVQPNTDEGRTSLEINYLLEVTAVVWARVLWRYCYIVDH